VRWIRAPDWNRRRSRDILRRAHSGRKSIGARIRLESSCRCSRGELHNRGREVRHLPDHRFILDARRVDSDDRHQFGFGRERYFWSFVVALVLFVLGSGFAIYEGIEKIRHPHPISNVWVALGVLAFAIVVEGYSFRIAVRESRPLKGRLSWWQFIRRSRTPELPVVLLEDLGAQVGLIIAFIAVSISHWANAPVWDGIGTLAIGILLFVIAVILIVEMRSLLLGEGADPRDMARLRESIVAAPHVQRVLHVKTQHFGPEELLVAARIDFSDELSTEELAAAIEDVERLIRETVPYAHPIYIEPAANDSTGE
jgi:cation diffusion facilitator family transporter